MRTSVKLLSFQCARQLVARNGAFETLPAAAQTHYFRTQLFPNQLSFERTLCGTPDGTCWNCKKTVRRKNQFFCSECGSLQDADRTSNYFRLLERSVAFNVNPTELTTKFRQLQNVLHPDKYSNRPEREQSNSLEWSSLLNKAYKTLSVPIDRGEYILELQGITLPQDNSALDKEFLMEMMERNEDVEDATKENIFELLEAIRADLDKAAVELERVFGEKDFEKAKFVLVKMKYFKSLEKSIKDKATRMGAVK